MEKTAEMRETKSLKPKISFVLPTFNRSAWLAECIESLRNQTVQEIEIIVVDDCSTDTTPELMDWYVKQDARIISIRNEKNMKAGESRNIGNRSANADIICVCDSDDYYPKDRAEFTIDYFRKNKKVDIVNGSYIRVGYSNEMLEEFKAVPFSNKAFLEKAPIYFCHPSCAYRRESILELPYKPETKEVTDDYQLLTDWVNAGKVIKSVDKLLCYHRVLPSSMMTEMRGGSLE